MTCFDRVKLSTVSLLLIQYFPDSMSQNNPIFSQFTNVICQVHFNLWHPLIVPNSQNCHLFNASSILPTSKYKIILLFASIFSKFSLFRVICWFLSLFLHCFLFFFNKPIRLDCWPSLLQLSFLSSGQRTLQSQSALR